VRRVEPQSGTYKIPATEDGAQQLRAYSIANRRIKRVVRHKSPRASPSKSSTHARTIDEIMPPVTRTSEPIEPSECASTLLKSDVSLVRAHVGLL